MLNKTQLADFQTELTNRKKELEARFEGTDHFQLQRSLSDSTRELSVYDNHPGDVGTELYEREKDIALNEHSRFELEGINTALEAIQNETYGICKTCKEEIPVERLEAVPTTLFCLKHSQDQNISNDRPVEEAVLAPPFGQFDFDDKSENVAYDAEDAWQDVAQYGTSETPADFMNSPEEYGDMYVESQENKGYVEDYENFAAVDIHGNRVDVYPSREHKLYEEVLDDEDLMSSLGDLPPAEKDPYTERK
ncbi:TraR/DksA C4-type zinc finger protein [Domibacillus sp. DTU_2020_1001157_1_SI_ALB_TIR_016]|uniref:TraR/DksA C4-type zinc finger protein n=1 Tax=Domibacillus sp. DTU_2020_1001157_1_SI_ALB_TIR_016 TaxID=3077789 RepID=UPI0028F028C7|nr:TraR/DksA C4-type zinc finger protein [Domibacillus sp. DTU_2020_1001157_1_SI_ALB_TIR_016]WNS79460.1 TraR/DksA C4-type zinc finger protein [Domibacillus sp. DTU_2020_1001157_1_SI_ALB_TIR_016]